MKQKSQYNNSKVDHKGTDLIFTFLFLTSIALTIWGIEIYRITVIEIKYLFALVAIGTIVSFPITLYLYKGCYSIFSIFLFSIAIGGGLSYFGFLYLNKTLADKELLTDEFQITETGNLGRGKKSNCAQPYAYIDFNGFNKQLIFYCEYEKSISNYSKVSATYSEGFFSFEVIHSKRLIK